MMHSVCLGTDLVFMWQTCSLYQQMTSRPYHTWKKLFVCRIQRSYPCFLAFLWLEFLLWWVRSILWHWDLDLFSPFANDSPIVLVQFTKTSIMALVAWQITLCRPSLQSTEACMWILFLYSWLFLSLACVDAAWLSLKRYGGVLISSGLFPWLGLVFSLFVHVCVCQMNFRIITFHKWCTDGFIGRGNFAAVFDLRRTDVPVMLLIPSKIQECLHLSWSPFLYYKCVLKYSKKRFCEFFIAECCCYFICADPDLRSLKW